jgi:hypothetical protein
MISIGRSTKHEARNSKQIQNSKIQNSKPKEFAAGGGCFVLIIWFLVI